MKRLLVIVAMLGAIWGSCLAKRTFVHPGITYTQGQLDRMKAMVEAKVEPYYTTFLKMKSTEYTDLNRRVYDRGTQIKEGSFNGTVGIDGRCAHDLALLWHITGDHRYADKAVEFLNANSHYTNTSARGTGPLDNGKVNLLIEAAELMRDYDGWEPEDQQRFKDMLTYPYYSNTENVAEKFIHYLDDSQNGVTFYWNIYNGDSGRYGNQGMFGMLAMLAMGVYLDNEIIYDRALRYISGLPHRPDDLPYVPGPPVRNKMYSSKDEYQKTYSVNARLDTIEDYGYDELLQYYFYPNGQCQESSRDQGHVLCGTHKFAEFAEIAWNQGDRFYSLLDNRLLKGLEFNYRYNLSLLRSYPDQPEPWEPAGYTSNWDEVTLENNMYLQTPCRSQRWESISPSPAGRGNISNTGARPSAYAHYVVRAGESEENTKWLRRSYDYTQEIYGFDTFGGAPSWYYEWNGWGTLTKHLQPWMAGDPVHYQDGQRVSGIHHLPGSINAADYDYYNINEDGEGHTYHRSVAAPASAYRPDGGVALKESSGIWVVSDNHDGDWLSYTVTAPLSDTYDVYVTYRSDSAVTIGASVACGDKVSSTLPSSSVLSEALIGTVEFPAGASVIRLFTDVAGSGLEIASIRVVYNSRYEAFAELTGSLDAQLKKFNAQWDIQGMIPQEINVWRHPLGKEDEAEIISSNNTFWGYEDKALGDTVPGYSYWLSYKVDGVEKLTDKISFEWGLLNDSFENEEVSQWSIPGANGTGEYADGCFLLSPDSKGASRLGRAWSFPFHGGNFPILALRMKRPEGVTTALYSASNSWGNGYDTFAGRIDDDVYYYDLLQSSFQNTKGVSKLEISPEKVTSVAMQLRTSGPVDADPIEMHWVKTFRNVEDLKAFVENEESAVEAIDLETEYGQIYNLFGQPCGRNLYNLPTGIYIVNGKKVFVR